MVVKCVIKLPGVLQICRDVRSHFCFVQTDIMYIYDICRNNHNVICLHSCFPMYFFVAVQAVYQPVWYRCCSAAHVHGECSNTSCASLMFIKEVKPLCLCI